MTSLRVSSPNLFCSVNRELSKRTCAISLSRTTSSDSVCCGSSIFLLGSALVTSRAQKRNRSFSLSFAISPESSLLVARGPRLMRQYPSPLNSDGRSVCTYGQQRCSPSSSTFAMYGTGGGCPKPGGACISCAMGTWMSRWCGSLLQFSVYLPTMDLPITSTRTLASSRNSISCSYPPSASLTVPCQVSLIFSWNRRFCTSWTIFCKVWSGAAVLSSADIAMPLSQAASASSQRLSSCSAAACRE
mmetsp:Transcript_110154/g.311742  ORF Transcript_110154/g.311742 Transcript_110154/m.311742 type:complete len:245 (-) Transcript_110154:715-1449(-)